MAPKNVTPARLLTPLLPWLNGDESDVDKVADALVRFLNRFSASEGRDMLWPAAGRVFSRTRDVARRRRGVLAAIRGEQVELPSLRFGLWRTSSEAARETMLREARAQLGRGPLPGGRVVVRGAFHDLILYAIVRVLAEPGGVKVAECRAPAAYDWKTKCGRLLIAGGGRRGRVREFCSDACRVRANRKSQHDRGR